MTNPSFASAPILDVPTATLRQRTSEKWSAYPADVLPLWVAEMDCTPAPGIVDAVERAMRLGDTGYQIGRRYQEAHARFAADTWGWEYDPALAVTVPDTMHGLVALLRLLMPGGGRVVTAVPVYPPFLLHPVAAGFEVVTARLGEGGRLDMAAMADALDRARADGSPATVLLCNPHNPTGVVHTAAAIAAVGEVARAHGAAVVSDEIHAPLTFVPFTPALSVLPDAYAVCSASKTWNLAGLRGAVAVSGPEAPRPVTDLPAAVTGCISHVAILAHEAAFDTGREWRAQLLTELEDRHSFLADELAARIPAAHVHPAEGTYLAWVDMRQVRTARGTTLGDDPARWILRNARVALSSGRPFDPDGPQGFVRVNVAASRDVIAEAVERIADALARDTGEVPVDHRPA